MVDTSSDLGREFNKKRRKPSITQKMINTTDERRKWKNVIQKGRENYRIMRNQLKRAKDKTNKEYLEKICDEIMKFKEQDVMI